MQKIKVFKENSMESLEKKINDFIVGKQVVNISFAMYHKKSKGARK